MMPVEWPLAASAADRPVEPARPRAGRDRLAVAMADFFLDEGSRLTDEERALMAAMLRGLVTDIADELIAGLPPMLARPGRTGARRALSPAAQRPACWSARGWSRCCFAGRTSSNCRPHADRNRSDPLASLVGDDDAAVAEAAMALTLARGRRRDRFGRLGVEFDDFAAEDAVALVHAVAAALRRDAWPTRPTSRSAAAAQALLARHDEGRRLEAAWPRWRGRWKRGPRRRRAWSDAWPRTAMRRCWSACWRGVPGSTSSTPGIASPAATR